MDIESYTSEEQIKDNSLIIEASGCNDIIKCFNEIFNNWKVIERILKIDSRPLQYLYNLKPATVEEVNTNQVEKIKKIVDDIYSPNNQRPFQIYPVPLVDQTEFSKFDYYINKVKQEKYGIENYILKKEYRMNVINASGNLVNLVKYHLKSIQIFESIILSRIEMYNRGQCKNWFHWFAVFFGKDYRLSESAKNLERFRLEVTNALQLEPETLLDNFKKIPTKLEILMITYKEYLSSLSTYKTDVSKNLTEKERNDKRETYENTVRNINYDFTKQMDKLFSCFNICDSVS